MTAVPATTIQQEPGGHAGSDGTDPPMWAVCSGCRVMVYKPRRARNSEVCPECGRHGALTAPERIAHLMDEGSVQLIPVPLPDLDPLTFVDTEPYPDRVRRARERTGLDEAVVCASGTIGGHRVVLAVMDFRFLGGSLGAAVGEAVTRAADLALDARVPLVLVTASGGARMQEGVISLMQMAKTAAAITALNEEGILTICLITDPTYGGVAASFATLGDVIVAEPGARLGFAGPRVIEQTIQQTLPPGFQTAEFLITHGIIDLISSRSELPALLAKLLSHAAPPDVEPGAAGRAEAGRDPQPRDGSEPQPGRSEVLISDPAQLAEREPWDVVRAARRLGRPTTLDYASLILEDFVELHGDRISSDCTAIVAGLGRLDGQTVALIGTQKGRTAQELAARNFGMPTPAGYRKAARVMRLAARLKIPVITLIDTAGAYPGLVAEEQGQAGAVAENLRLMNALPVPIVAVVTGEGGSGGALALAVADRVLMCANAVYSVISPEGCAAILWKDTAAAPKAAAALKLDARHLLQLGIVDGVIPEPDNGSHVELFAAAAHVKDALASALRSLAHLPPTDLIKRRRDRYRRYGINSVERAGDAGMSSTTTRTDT